MDRHLTDRRWRRCVVGRDVVIIRESLTEVCIEGQIRLRPGSYVELCDDDVRLVCVCTWVIVRLGKSGPVYRGVCRWNTPEG